MGKVDAINHRRIVGVGVKPPHRQAEHEQHRTKHAEYLAVRAKQKCQSVQGSFEIEAIFRLVSWSKKRMLVRGVAGLVFDLWDAGLRKPLYNGQADSPVHNCINTLSLCTGDRADNFIHMEYRCTANR